MKTIVYALPVMLLAGYVSAAQPQYAREIPADLASKAKVSEDAAVSTALSKVPSGRVTSVELESMHKKLIYSVDIQAPNKSGVEEVQVDAVTGKVLRQHHESAKTEAKEAAGDIKEGAQSPKYAP